MSVPSPTQYGTTKVTLGDRESNLCKFHEKGKGTMAIVGHGQEASTSAQPRKENLGLTVMEMGQEMRPSLKSGPGGTKHTPILSTPIKKQSGPLLSLSDYYPNYRINPLAHPRSYLAIGNVALVKEGFYFEPCLTLFSGRLEASSGDGDC